MTAIRTMIVEDDLRIADIQNRFLDKLPGFEAVGMAYNLEDCEEMVEVLNPDLILLDVYFPDGNGLDFLKSLRLTNRHIEVILITAAKDVESLKAAMQGGVFDYVVKPLEFNRLRDSLNRFESYFNRLKTLHTLEQSDIDDLLPRTLETNTRSRVDIQLPKGIDALTLAKIRELFSSTRESLGAELVGHNIGASRTTARRYLEYLVSTDELQVDVSYGGVGRPERHYCRT
ncbi:MAG: response regulator [Gammaproteobacteria bacterium]|nr:response regulator [Gammaproteobacteria bacterium]